MKIGLFISTVVFLLFAYLQLNDPDAVLWIAIYMFPVFANIIVLLKKNGRWLFATTALAALIYAIYLVPGYSENYFDNEEARESFGLFIVAGYLFWLIFITRSKRLESHSSE